MPVDNLVTEGDDSTPCPDNDDLLNYTADTIIVVNELRIELCLPTKIVQENTIEMFLSGSIEKII